MVSLHQKEIDMISKKIYKKFSSHSAINDSIKLIKFERVKAPTAKGQMETIRYNKIIK